VFTQARGGIGGQGRVLLTVTAGMHTEAGLQCALHTGPPL
jgi:hypothetical protein